MKTFPLIYYTYCIYILIQAASFRKILNIIRNRANKVTQCLLPPSVNIHFCYVYFKLNKMSEHLEIILVYTAHVSPIPFQNTGDVMKWVLPLFECTLLYVNFQNLYFCVFHNFKIAYRIKPLGFVKIGFSYTMYVLETRYML